MNSLITNLPSSVSDETLFKINEAVLGVNFADKTFTSATQKKLVLNVSKETTLRIVGDGYFTDSTLVKTTDKEKTINGETEVYVDGTEFLIYLGNISYFEKFDFLSGPDNRFAFLKGFWSMGAFGKFTGTGCIFNVDLADFNFSRVYDLRLNSIDSSFNLSIFKESSALAIFQASSCKNLEGDISNFSNIENLGTLYLHSSSQVKGSLNSLNGRTNFKEIYAYGTAVEGSLEAFFESLKGLKKNSSVTVKGWNSNILYNGSSFDTKTATYDADGNYTVSG